MFESDKGLSQGEITDELNLKLELVNIFDGIHLDIIRTSPILQANFRAYIFMILNGLAVKDASNIIKKFRPSMSIKMD